jgi:hypothetical protein
LVAMASCLEKVAHEFEIFFAFDGFGIVVRRFGFVCFPFFVGNGGEGSLFAVDMHEDVEFALVVLTNFFRVVFGAEGFGGVIAIFLEFAEFTAEAAEGADDAAIFEGFGGELGAGDGVEEETGEVGGGELEADFRELRGVFDAKELQEVVLLDVMLDGEVLFVEPFAVAAASFPVGDVLFGDVVVEFFESGDDVFVRDTVLEHLVDEVAFEFGEASDDAVAAAGGENGCWMLDDG